MVAQSSRRSVTISRLATSFGLTRSTLLHYDRIGLLKPSATSRSGYRIYDASAHDRLARIVQLRTAGLPLRTIKRVLNSQTALSDALEKQVAVLNEQLTRIREQQRVVLSLLQLSAQTRPRTMTKDSWTRMFRAIGMTDDDMHAWHATFERTMPDAHRDFLASLNLDADEIERIRSWSRSRGD